ncbi:aminotransferase class I/II-fold pyridoxal phosphate-dependent enzyme [Candidatus Woesearchaeota archaeon]|nr:aminotransferase class I/II-fold pyridoxal phosphate-dependent enzyme [Candidatus Woesearchaeota archaeon]
MVEISEREQELPDLEIEKLLEIAVEHPEIISLGPGEPDFDLHNDLVVHTKKIAHLVNHYAPAGGFKEFREALAKKLKKDNKIKTSPDNIVVTCGSQDALILGAACCLDVSEQIILPNPGYMAFLSTFELFNANPRFVDLKEEDEYAVNPDEVRKQINKKKTKVLLINSPANPTGNVLSKKILEELADIAVENDLYVFSDEAYEKIVFDGAKHYSIGSFNGMKKYAVTFQTFSKSYAMCGHRLGYVVAPPKLAEAIKKTHVITTVCAPTISQLLGIKALKMGDKHAKQMVKEYERRRKLIVPRLNEMGISCPMPKGAFYAFGNITDFDKSSKRFVLNMIKKAKVAAVPGIDFGPAGEGHVRFSFATKYNLIKKALDRMEPWLKKYRKR